MRRFPAVHAVTIALSLTLGLLCAANPAAADLYSDYEHRPARDFQLPQVLSGSQGGTLLDNLPDGRLVMMTTRESAPFTTDGVELRIETAVGSRDFRYLGDIPFSGGMDSIWFNPGGFLTINNNGSNPQIAVGNSSSSLAVFGANELDVLPTLAAPAPAPLAITWFDNLGADLSVDGSFIASAAWRSDTILAVGSADGSKSQVHLLDATSSPAAPAVTLVIDNAPFGTGGLSFDENGSAYFGVGYGPGVGDIRRFDTSGWPATQNFADGTLVTTLLSAGWIQFDVAGNLLVGGGDTFGSKVQLNYFAIQNALSQQRLFDPDTVTGTNAYNLAYNPVTGEILVWDNFTFVADPQHVFVFAAETVPEPATWALMLIGLVSLGAVAVSRRKYV